MTALDQMDVDAGDEEQFEATTYDAPRLAKPACERPDLDQLAAGIWEDARNYSLAFATGNPGNSHRMVSRIKRALVAAAAWVACDALTNLAAADEHKLSAAAAKEDWKRLHRAMRELKAAHAEEKKKAQAELQASQTRQTELRREVSRLQELVRQLKPRPSSRAKGVAARRGDAVESSPATASNTVAS